MIVFNTTGYVVYLLVICLHVMSADGNNYHHEEIHCSKYLLLFVLTLQIREHTD